MRHSRQYRQLKGVDTYELCIDLMIESQRTIDKIDLMIRQLENKAIDESDTGYLTAVKDLKQYHSNILSLKAFISDYLLESIENFE